MEHSTFKEGLLAGRAEGWVDLGVTFLALEMRACHGSYCWLLVQGTSYVILIYYSYIQIRFRVHA